jgi:hypothetical protein
MRTGMLIEWVRLSSMLPIGIGNTESKVTKGIPINSTSQYTRASGVGAINAADKNKLMTNVLRVRRRVEWIDSSRNLTMYSRMLLRLSLVWRFG